MTNRVASQEEEEEEEGGGPSLAIRGTVRVVCPSLFFGARWASFAEHCLEEQLVGREAWPARRTSCPKSPPPPWLSFPPVTVFVPALCRRREQPPYLAAVSGSADAALLLLLWSCTGRLEDADPAARAAGPNSFPRAACDADGPASEDARSPFLGACCDALLREFGPPDCCTLLCPCLCDWRA